MLWIKNGVGFGLQFIDKNKQWLRIGENQDDNVYNSDNHNYDNDMYIVHINGNYYDFPLLIIIIILSVGWSPSQTLNGCVPIFLIRVHQGNWSLITDLPMMKMPWPKLVTLNII